MGNGICSIDGCDKPLRSSGAKWCSMHYFRWYRTGDPGGPGRRKRDKRNDECLVDGCSKPDQESGMCSMHAARMRRHGDVEVCISPAGRRMHYREDHHNWVGDGITYSGAHARVRAWRGPASAQACVDCGKQAEHWSYGHCAERELLATGRTLGMPYSSDPDDYYPRCAMCHKRFDMGRLEA